MSHATLKSAVEFEVRTILHAGEGPVDERVRAARWVCGAYSTKNACEVAVPDLIRDEVGLPSFDDSGEDTLEYYLCVENHRGERKAYRATARLEIKVDVEEIPMPK